MKPKNIDYYTVAGLAIFVFLSMIYICRDYIGKIHFDLPVDTTSINLPVPAINIPAIDLGWYQNLDPASKIIAWFIGIILLATLVGSILMLFVYRRKRAG